MFQFHTFFFCYPVVLLDELLGDLLYIQLDYYIYKSIAYSDQSVVSFHCSWYFTWIYYTFVSRWVSFDVVIPFHWICRENTSNIYKTDIKSDSFIILTRPW